MSGGGATHDLHPGSQRLGDAPGLGYAATGSEWGIPIEDLGDAAYPVIGKMMSQRLKKGKRSFRIFVDPQMG